MQKGRHGLYVTVAIFGSCGHSRQAQVICRQLWVQLAGTCSTSAVLDSADRRRQFWTHQAETGFMKTAEDTGGRHRLYAGNRQVNA